ncbi:MAG: hypothetical protein JOZ93_00505 [Sinobacteraceae bacterium]|nr:hypothetical protein [Nevskiaceae bacterium]
MTALALVLVTLAGVPDTERESAAARLVSAGTRYALSALGPVTVSAAHFIAALIFLHTLPRAAFGEFSFLIIVSAFCLSFCGALFAPPIARDAGRPDGMAEAERHTLFKANAAFTAVAAVAVSLLLFFGGADPLLASIFGLYGGTMSARWFARCWTYADGGAARVLASDLAYSGTVTVGLFGLLFLHRVTVWSAAVALLIASSAGLAAFHRAFWRQQLQGIIVGRLKPFLLTWRELSSWAVLGVAMSEATVNAHAYLVTFISGPHAFALLAIGTLLMRPVSLVLAALPDMERPLMSRMIREGKTAGAFRIVKEFRTAAGAIWLGAVLLAGVLLLWFPSLIVKREYPLAEVAVVVSISAAIMALRAVRTPEAVLLQAAGEFRKLAGVGIWSGFISLGMTFMLLMMFGPLAALCGILTGDIVATERTFALWRIWKAEHA